MVLVFWESPNNPEGVAILTQQVKFQSQESGQWPLRRRVTSNRLLPQSALGLGFGVNRLASMCLR